jgi:predicted double-glycine peptidase
MDTRIIASFLIGAIISACILLLLINCVGTPVAGHAGIDVDPVLLSGVPDVRQAEYYSCGASSFQAVLCYWGLESFETDLRTALNTTPGHGTYPWDMVRVAESLGLEAEWRDNLTLTDLEASVQDGVPVIVDSQRWRESGKTWEDSWATGHYMVVIGTDDRSVYLEDPAILGVRLAMGRDEFVQSWHDYEGELSAGTAAPKYYRLGVFIRGESPAKRPAFTTWDVIPTYVLSADLSASNGA